MLNNTTHCYMSGCVHVKLRSNHLIALSINSSSRLPFFFKLLTFKPSSSLSFYISGSPLLMIYFGSAEVSASGIQGRLSALRLGLTPRRWPTDLYDLKQFISIIIPGHPIHLDKYSFSQSVYQYLTHQLDAENRLFENISGPALYARRQFPACPHRRISLRTSPLTPMVI